MNAPANDGGERRAILAVILSLAVYWMWMSWVVPPVAPEDSALHALTEQVEDVSPATNNEVGSEGGAPLEGLLPNAIVDEVDAAPVRTPSTPLAAEVLKPVDVNGWSGEWTSKGGKLHRLNMSKYQAPTETNPIYSWAWKKVTGQAPGGWVPYPDVTASQELLAPQSALISAGVGDALGQDADDYRVVSVTETGAEFERVHSNGIKVVKRYVFGESDYVARVELRFENMGPDAVSGPFWAGIGNQMGGSAGRYANVSRPALFVEDDFEQVDDLEDALGAGKAFSGEASWIGITDRYFLAALVPDDRGGRAVVHTTEDYGGSYYLFENKELRPGDSFTGSFDVYAGPKDLALLKDAGNDLEKAVRFGWFGFFAHILLTLLEFFHSIVGNWGLSIIVLTVFVKGLFFPLTQKAFLSAKKMQALQPQLKEIREKYADNKELQSRETMEVFKANEVNPLGGCLPTLIQLPVWIALYNVLLFSVELYHTEFLYLKDLSAPDPTGIMPLVVGVLMFFQQRMTPMTGMDPMQAKMMRLMPLIFVVFIFSFPSGLAVYIFMNSGLTVIQQWFIYRNYDRANGAAGAPGKTA